VGSACSSASSYTGQHKTEAGKYHFTWAGFESTIPGFEQSKTTSALDCTTTGIGI